jgi:hypothetical protein
LSSDGTNFNIISGGSGYVVVSTGIQSKSGQPLNINSASGQNLSLGEGTTGRWIVQSSTGTFYPSTSGYNIGSSGHPAGLVYGSAPVAVGTAPTTNTGTCTTIGSATGAAGAGKFATTASCGSGTTIVLSGLPAAPNGYACHANDNTTTATILIQSAYSTTSATFKTSAATGTTDTITYLCSGF